MGVVVAFAPPAVRELGLGLAQQGLVGITYVLPALPGPTPVGVDNQARRGSLGQQGPLQSDGNQGLGHVGPRLPAHDVLGAYVLKGAQVRPGPAG